MLLHILFHHLVSASTTNTGQSSQGIALFLALTLILLTFLVFLALLTIFRRRRTLREHAQRQAVRDKARSSTTDPWFEAGRRAKDESDPEQ